MSKGNRRFTMIYNDVFDLFDGMDSQTFRIYMTILYYGENAHPSLSTLQKKIVISRNTLQLKINRLVKMGLLKKVYRKGTSNKYVANKSIIPINVTEHKTNEPIPNETYGAKTSLVPNEILGGSTRIGGGPIPNEILETILEVNKTNLTRDISDTKNKSHHVLDCLVGKNAQSQSNKKVQNKKLCLDGYRKELSEKIENSKTPEWMPDGIKKRAKLTLIENKDEQVYIKNFPNFESEQFDIPSEVEILMQEMREESQK